MSALATWSGCVGAWLLVAGPIYQAAIELAAEGLERDELVAAAAAAQPERPMSPWWWLLPPVGYALQRRRSRQAREAMMQVLTMRQLEQMVRFIDKATGWLFVGSGAFFIAMKETWELRELYEWPVVVFWALVVVLLIACAANTAIRIRRSQGVLQAKAASGS